MIGIQDVWVIYQISEVTEALNNVSLSKSQEMVMPVFTGYLESGTVCAGLTFTGSEIQKTEVYMAICSDRTS